MSTKSTTTNGSPRVPAVEGDPIPLIYNTSLSTFEPPIPPDHQCVYMAQLMAEVHNMFIRAFNSAYAHSYSVKPNTSSADDLLFYIYNFCTTLHLHHSWEETTYFPLLEKVPGGQGLMLDVNVNEHAAFEEPLTRLEAYAKGAGQKGYDAELLRELMRAAAGPLGRHLSQEPDRFYQLRHLDSDALKKVIDEATKVVVAKTNMWTEVPLAFGNDDHACHINGMPSIHPTIFPWFFYYLVHYVVAWRYRRIWVFNSCDFWGRQK